MSLAVHVVVFLEHLSQVEVAVEVRRQGHVLAKCLWMETLAKMEWTVRTQAEWLATLLGMNLLRTQEPLKLKMANSNHLHAVWC